MKICIIGYSGSGKSTLAKKLSSFYNIPCLHLDNVQFYGSFQRRSLSQQNQITNEFYLKILIGSLMGIILKFLIFVFKKVI